MAKSLRSHGKKRARSLMRATVGARQANKNMRKTVRQTFKALLATGSTGTGGLPGGLTEGALREMLGGAVPAGAAPASATALVTLAPRLKRKLPYTFNTSLREQRLEQAVEDETDDEAEDKEAEAAADSEAEERAGEPEPTGAATAGQRAVIRNRMRGARAAAASGMEVEGGEAEAAFMAASVIQSGRTKGVDKPVGKRDMSAEFYEYAKRDIINPDRAGFFDVPAGARKLAKGKRRGASKAAPFFAPAVPFVRQ